MRLLSSLSLVMACVMTLHGEETDESWEIHGRVVDAAGKPVEEFEIGTFWSANGNYWDESGERKKIKAQPSSARFGRTKEFSQ